MRNVLPILVLGAAITTDAAARSGWMDESGTPPRLPAGAVAETLPRPAGATAVPRGAVTIDIDPFDRAAVSRLFRERYPAQDAQAIDQVNVDVGSCDAGSTPQAAIDATLQRINLFRALAGLPGTVDQLGPGYRDQVQAAALIFAANPDDPLSHTPPDTYACWTQEGHEGALRSNLHRGRSSTTAGASSGPRAISSYMDDAGAGNAIVGHRRWLLYPPQVRMASGDALAPAPEPFPFVAANVLWVTGELPGYTFGPRPPTPDGTAWPPRGYVPWQLLPKRSNRWSFSYPQASFCNATVAMSRDGTPIATTIVADGTSEGHCPPDPGAGTIADPTLVWEPAPGAVEYETPPATDQSYEITISGIAGPGVPPGFAYTVTVIDPYDAVFADGFES